MIDLQLKCLKLNFNTYLIISHIGIKSYMVVFNLIIIGGKLILNTNINIRFKIFKQRRHRYWILAELDYGTSHLTLYTDNSIMNALGISENIYEQMALQFNGIVDESGYIFSKRKDINNFKNWLKTNYIQYLVLKQLV